MGPLVLVVLVYLLGTALAAAVPLATPALPPRQFLQPQPSPPAVVVLPPPGGVAPDTAPPLGTILGIQTHSFVTQSSTTTSFVPSSTTTRTFTFTPAPSIITTISETTVIEETIETIVQPDPTGSAAAASSDSTGAANAGASPNGSSRDRGSSAAQLGGVLLFGVLLAVQPW